ncbi:MAG: flagellar hook-basal body complex protein [Alphaproteobacteria bacterium]|nr:flagellar hook-basal body complex protein [Alphaproteobacteria bacterium]
MGLFGSLFTGVSALFAQSQNTAIIANNIANVNTTGFKRSEAAFESLVTSQSRLTTYSPGTVTVRRQQRVKQQGALQQTASGTDASVSGNGFFPIKRGADSQQEYLYTRAGQFSEDSQGLLRNAAGFVLYAWPLSTDGSLPANQGDLTSLVPANVAFLGGLTRPTSGAELAINLDSNDTSTAEVTLASALTSPAGFSRGITVYDTLGSAQTLTFNFTKTYGPQATATSTVSNLEFTTGLISDLGLTDGNQFSLSIDGGAARVYEVNTSGGATSGTEDAAVVTIGDIIDDINTNVVGANAYVGNGGEIIIQRSDFTGGAAETITLANVIGTPLTGLGLTAATYASDDLDSATYDNGAPADSPAYGSEGFPSFRNLPGDVLYNPRGWWQMQVMHPNGSVISTGVLNFNGDGTLNANSDTSGNIDVELDNIDWGNGSELQGIDVDIERFSQFSGDFDVIFSDQNGAELGLRTGVELTRDGLVVARFSNGASADLYKVPLITFANPNGLTEVSGTAFSESEESGEENLREAGSGGAGFVEPSTLEASNVDLADEFARLITSQRAFGAATRTINTVDQMTQDLLSLRG